MAPITVLGLTSCSLLLALCAMSGTSKPAGNNMPMEEPGTLQQFSNMNAYQDERWRMLSAISTLKLYSSVLSGHYIHEPGVIRINTNNMRHKKTKKILSSVCNLVAFYELVTKVDPTTNDVNLYPLLSEVIRASCNWMKYLVDNTNTFILTKGLYNFTCLPTEVTPLHHYCYQTRARCLLNLTNVGNSTLDDSLTMYYLNDMIMPTSWNKWLNGTSLPPEQINGIKLDIRGHILMAILQYMLESKESL